MNSTRIIVCCLIVFTQFCSYSSTANPKDFEVPVSRNYFYQGLTGYQQSLFEGFILAEFPAGKTVEQILTNEASLRSETRLAQALLFRNKPGDLENAIKILKWILKNQHTDEKSMNYGLWKTNVGNDRLDQNWREFIGCDLILIYKNYKHLLSPQLLADIKAGLIRAAKGAFKRDVRADYTNISIMSAFLMDYTGTEFKIDELRTGGLKKAREIYGLFQRHQTFSEYNSPTYYGVTLIALAFWRELASDKMKKMGMDLEKSLWVEIASNYNPTLKNMVGPYFRGYGMDMKKYFAITGIWIAVALNDEKLAPLPRGGGAKEGEMSNISTLFHLGLAIPKEVLLQLNEFTPRTFIDRLVPSKIAGDTLKHVTAIVHSDWMMGGLWGNRRNWNQIKAGTIHWNNSVGETEWMLVPGDGKTNILVSKTSMKIYSATAESTSFSVYVYAKDLTETNFSEKSWKFPSMNLGINSGLKRTYQRIIDPTILYDECAISEEYSSVMKITFQIPPSWNIQKPLLEISPTK